MKWKQIWIFKFLYSYSCCFDDYFIEEMNNVHRHVCISDFSITLVENFVILIKALLA